MRLQVDPDLVSWFVSFLRRLFSSDYRRAVAAEAAGDYVTAARAYALAGDRAKVGEMMIERAARAVTPEAKLADLRTAIAWCEGDSDDARAARRRLARAFEAWATQAQLVSEADRDVLRQAAELHASVGEHRRAADCYERTGDSLLALQQLEQAGDVDKLEGLFYKEEQKRRRESRQSEALEDYRAAYRSGLRVRAREALLRGLEGEGRDDRLGLRRMLEELDARRLGHAVVLDDGSERRRFVVGEQLSLGRDDQCEVPLGDAGVSRKHARLAWHGEHLQLSELGSRNGTRWRGLPIEGGGAGAVVIDGDGELQCGPEAKLELQRRGPRRLLLTLRSGAERGLTIVFSPEPVELRPELQLGLGEGGWLTITPSGKSHSALRLNDQPIAGAFQPLRGDRVELPEARYEIAR